jgi:hypothetical protein
MAILFLLAKPMALRDDHLVPVQMQASFLDWNEEYAGPKFDLVLACDVLYEASLFCPRSSPALRLFAKVSSLGPGINLVFAAHRSTLFALQDFSVEPVGNLLPQLLSDTGQILLADPSERTRHNRHGPLLLEPI